MEEAVGGSTLEGKEGHCDATRRRILYVQTAYCLFGIDPEDLGTKPHNKIEDLKEPPLAPILQFHREKLPIGMGICNWNSTWYMIGGEKLRKHLAELPDYCCLDAIDYISGFPHVGASPDVYIFEPTFASHPKKKSKPVRPSIEHAKGFPRMISGKVRPFVESIAGKIFVHHSYPIHLPVSLFPYPVFEFYDPEENSWKEVPDVPYAVRVANGAGMTEVGSISQEEEDARSLSEEEEDPASFLERMGPTPVADMSPFIGMGYFVMGSKLFIPDTRRRALWCFDAARMEWDNESSSNMFYSFTSIGMGFPYHTKEISVSPGSSCHFLLSFHMKRLEYRVIPQTCVHLTDDCGNILFYQNLSNQLEFDHIDLFFYYYEHCCFIDCGNGKVFAVFYGKDWKDLDSEVSLLHLCIFNIRPLKETLQQISQDHTSSQVEKDFVEVVEVKNYYWTLSSEEDSVFGIMNAFLA